MTPPATPPSWPRCDLCGRQVPPAMITQHHLTPKQKGGQPEHRTPMCHPCHKQVHAVFSNNDLAKLYADIAALRQSPQLRPFIRWIRKQNPQSNFTVRTSNAHPDQRRRSRGR